MGGPNVDDFGPEGLGGQGVHMAEGLVHEEDFGVHRQGPGHADPLFHAAGKFPRIGFLEARQAHHLDGLLGAILDLIGREAPGLEGGLDVFGHRHPGKKGEALEHNGDARVQVLQGAGRDKEPRPS